MELCRELPIANVTQRSLVAETMSVSNAKFTKSALNVPERSKADAHCVTKIVVVVVRFRFHNQFFSIQRFPLYIIQLFLFWLTRHLHTRY